MTEAQNPSAVMAKLMQHALRVADLCRDLSTGDLIVSTERQSGPSLGLNGQRPIHFRRVAHPDHGPVYCPQEQDWAIAPFYRQESGLLQGGAWINPLRPEILHFSSAGMVPVMVPAPVLRLPAMALVDRHYLASRAGRRELEQINLLIKNNDLSLMEWTALAEESRAQKNFSVAEYCQARADLLNPALSKDAAKKGIPPARLSWG